MDEQDKRPMAPLPAVGEVKKQWPFIAWILLGVIAGVLTRWFLLK